MASRELTVSRLEQLPCPSCGEYLERGKGRHGLVWLCRGCRAGAVTLPILRQVAPRAFVNHLWQAALHAGRPSALRCPACAQPFTTFAARGDVAAQIKVCVRCFWVWFGSETLLAFSMPPALPPAAPLLTDAARRDAVASGPAARRVLGSLAAGELAAALPPPARPRRRRTD
jgi:ribosomal protein L37AE/L43A